MFDDVLAEKLAAYRKRMAQDSRKKNEKI